MVINRKFVNSKHNNNFILSIILAALISQTSRVTSIQPHPKGVSFSFVSLDTKGVSFNFFSLDAKFYYIRRQSFSFLCYCSMNYFRIF